VFCELIGFPVGGLVEQCGEGNPPSGVFIEEVFPELVHSISRAVQAKQSVAANITVSMVPLVKEDGFPSSSWEAPVEKTTEYLYTFIITNK